MRTGKLLGRGAAVLSIALLAGCASTVRNYGLDDHFSPGEASTGSQSTPEQCAATTDAVWVEGPEFGECIRYFPSSAFASGRVARAIVFMDGDVLSLRGASANYGKWTPRRVLEAAQQEQQRGGTPYLSLARPGVDGSSGNQNRRRTRYETEVVNAALDRIKARYGIAEFGLVGQSGGGGLVASLIAERRDVRCAVSSSGVTAVVYRARAAGRSSDWTGTPLSGVWDPIDQLSRVHPMPGFRMFVTTDGSDTDVDAGSQVHYVEAAKAAGLPVEQLMVHGTGSSHHQTYRIGNRIVEDCMLGLPTAGIVRTYSGMDNGYAQMDALAARARALAAGQPAQAAAGPADRDARVAR
ncbi:alpha/beta fold hydrolase [Burkholderia sp. 22PA0099]|uniref:alpha/beta fold hydrolase n=1 Tax=Burkholderia sp. 22PA0099 TaxID=3237372 RepID=UPI0039C42C81